MNSDSGILRPRGAPCIELRIDRIVVEGFAGIRPEALAAEVERELVGRLAALADGPLPELRSARMVSRPAEVPRGAGADVLAAGVARVIAGEVRP